MPGFHRNRREFLAGVAGCSLSFALPALSAKGAEERGPTRAKSLILVWLEGGPSQLETWDPHPGSKVGGPTQAIDTNVPGLQIASTYPLLAEKIGHLSVIRSLVSAEGDHERGAYLLKTGFRPDPTTIHPSLGAILTHQLPNEGIEIPLHISLRDGQWPGRGGYLGDQYDAFKVFDPGQPLQNMLPPVEEARMKRRDENLKVVERAFANGRRVLARGTLHEDTVRKAQRMMTSKQLSAFKIEEEPKERVAAYGDTQFGRACLVARRLVETGVRAIEVTQANFDTHANNFEFHNQHAKTMDPALAALLTDLAERDLLASTVVLVLGEFGRTPQVNPLDGRDHWPSGFSCLIGGGGLKSGVVLGSTDPTGEKKEPEHPVPVQNLFATVLTQFGVSPKQEMTTPIGRPMPLSEGAVIEELAG